jgi:hypothetical protein
MPGRVTGDDASLAPTLPYLGARMISALSNCSVGYRTLHQTRAVHSTASGNRGKLSSAERRLWARR